MQQQTAVLGAPETVVDPSVRVWPTFNHEIGMTEAREMVGRWRRANPEKKAGAAYTRVALDRLLSQDGCAGIRMYYAHEADGAMTLVLVAVDEAGNDMDEGYLAEMNFPCPPFCAINSALDS